MSRELLLQLDAKRAFEARRRFHELTFGYVPFDSLVRDARVEAALNRAMLRHAGVIPVIAPSGGGKSALIAWCTQALGDGVAVIKLPVASLGADVASFTTFGQHVLRWTVKVASDLTAEQEEQLAAAGADVTTARGERRRAGARVAGGLPARMLSVELAGDLERSQLDRENHANAADVVAALQDLAAIFSARGSRLVLVVEDTDAWLARAGTTGPSEVADAFFADVIAVMARDVEIGVVVATHPEYTRLPGYLGLRERFAEITIPRLPDPRAALESLLAARVTAAASGASLADALTDHALTYLVAEYDNHAGNIRRVLMVCDTALEQVAPDYPDVLNDDHIRGAAVSLGL